MTEFHGASGHAIPRTETLQHPESQRLLKPSASSRQIRQEFVAPQLYSQGSQRSVACLPDEDSLMKTALLCFDIFQSEKVNKYSFMTNRTAHDIRNVLRSMGRSANAVMKNLEGFSFDKDISEIQLEAIHKIVIEYELLECRQSSHSEASARPKASESTVNRSRKYSPVYNMRAQASTSQTAEKKRETPLIPQSTRFQAINPQNDADNTPALTRGLKLRTSPEYTGAMRKQLQPEVPSSSARPGPVVPARSGATQDQSHQYHQSIATESSSSNVVRPKVRSSSSNSAGSSLLEMKQFYMPGSGSQLAVEGSVRARNTLDSRLQGKEKISVEPTISSSRVMMSSKPAKSAQQREKAERVLSDDSRELRQILRGLCIDWTKHDQIIAIKPHLMEAGVLENTLKDQIGLEDREARLLLECLRASDEDEIDSLMDVRQTVDMEGQAKRDESNRSGVRLSACKVKAMRTPSPKGAEASPINTSSTVTPVADGSRAAKASASQKPVTFSANQPLQKVWSPRKEQLIHIMQSAHTSFDHELIEEVLQAPRNPEFDLTAEEFATLKVRYEEWKANEHYLGLPVPSKIRNFSLRVREEKQLFEAVFGDLSASIHTPTSAASGRTFSPATPPRTEPVNFPERPFRANAGQIGLPGDDLATGFTRPSPYVRIPAIYENDLSAKVPPVKPVPFFDGAPEDVIDGAGVARGRQLRSESLRSSSYDELMLNPLNIQADGLEPSVGSFIPVQGSAASCSSTPVVTPTHELSAEDQEKIRLLTHYSKRELNDDEIREAIRLGMELDESVLGLMSHQDVVEFVRQLINENRRGRALGQWDQLHENAFRSGLKTLLNAQDDELPFDDGPSSLEGLSSLMTDLQAIQKQAQEGKQEIKRLADAESYPVRGYAHGTVSVMQGAGIQAARNNCAIASVLMGMSHRGSLSLLIEQIQEAVAKALPLRDSLRTDTVDEKVNRDNRKLLEAIGQLQVLDRVLVKYNSQRLESIRVNDELDEIRGYFELNKGVVLEPDEFFEQMVMGLRSLQSLTGCPRRIEIFNFPVHRREELSGMTMSEAFNRFYLEEVTHNTDSRLEDSDVLVLAPPTFGAGEKVGMVLSDKIEKFDSSGELVKYQLASTVNIASGHYVTFLREPESNRLYLTDSMGMRLGSDDHQPFMVPTVITMPIHGTEDALDEAIINTTNDADGALMHQTKDHWKNVNKHCRMAIYTRVNNH
ncbi:hypothetical protein [Endozoicomonas atrinae]|uniref:hypothetical protein n=1 Tax=Endozoicomonas atrinae TaxID=1333660 RepID=UPI003AFF8224